MAREDFYGPEEPYNPNAGGNAGGNSAMARAYFNSFPPAIQQEILASWGGDMGMMDLWYENALNAGAVPPTFRTGPGAGAGGNRPLWEMSPEEAGIAAWGTEIGGQNRQTRDMTPEQRARWAMEHIDNLMATPWNELSPQAQQDYLKKGWTPETYMAEHNARSGSAGSYQQWLEWDKFYDPDCPPDKPYRGAETGTGCYELPDHERNERVNAGGGGGQGGGRNGAGNETPGEGLQGSPASQAPTPGTPTGGGGASAPTPQGSTFAASSRPTSGVAQPAAPAPPVAPVKIPDAFTATGAAPSGASGGVPSPVGAPAPKPPGQIQGFSSFGGGRRSGGGWAGSSGSNWVASDERLKEGLGVRRPRLSEWRRNG